MNEGTRLSLGATAVGVEEAARARRIDLGYCGGAICWFHWIRSRRMTESTEFIRAGTAHPERAGREIFQRIARMTKLATITILAS
jgi:hypothetical protein